MSESFALAIGIFAALFMFCGDMLLYFTTSRDYKYDGTLNPIITVMQGIPEWRLMLGGLLGPITAFLYCIGFFHITVAALDGYKCFAFFIFLICSLGMIVGGAYHSHCTYIGLIKKEDNNIEKVFKNIKLMSSVSFILMAIGLFSLAIIIVLGKTQYPRWLALLTPGILYFLKLLWRKLPQPFLIILYGGWYNLMFAIYFFISLLLS